jgi:hypothetical protein
MTIETHFIKDGKITFRKTPGARLLYGWDLVDWLAETGTTLQTVTGTGAGIAADGAPFINGTMLCIWVTGLDIAQGAENSYTFRFVCVDGSIEYRTIHFIARPA